MQREKNDLFLALSFYSFFNLKKILILGNHMWITLHDPTTTQSAKSLLQVPPLRGEQTRYALEAPKLRVLPAMTPRAAMLANIQDGFARCDVARQARFLGGLVRHGEAITLWHPLLSAPRPFWCILWGVSRSHPRWIPALTSRRRLRNLDYSPTVNHLTPRLKPEG
jgi:hypothetical protein